MSWRVFLQVHDSLVLRDVKRNSDVIIQADYRALELTILADMCLRLFSDGQLAEMVKPGAPDVHGVNAINVFGAQLGRHHPDGTPIAEMPVEAFKTDAHCIQLRHLIKIVWYALQYGKTGYGLSTLEGPDGEPIGEEFGTKIVEAILSAVPGLKLWQQWCRDFVDRHRGIYSLDGRWCDLSEESDPGAPEWLRNRGYRRAYNFPMQAAGAGIIGDAMVRINQCHILTDSDTESSLAKTFLQRHMESATAGGIKLLVPLQVSVGVGVNYHNASH